VSRNVLRVAASEGVLAQMRATRSAWPRLATRCSAVFPLLVTPRRQLVLVPGGRHGCAPPVVIGAVVWTFTVTLLLGYILSSSQ
jgi:hypothetical protein